MNFAKKIEDYVLGEKEVILAGEKLNSIQSAFNNFLQETKGSNGEYTITDFEEIINQHYAIILAKGIFDLMNANISGLKTDILYHLELLKGGKLKLLIHNNFFLISKDGHAIIMQPA